MVAETAAIALAVVALAAIALAVAFPAVAYLVAEFPAVVCPVGDCPAGDCLVGNCPVGNCLVAVFPAAVGVLAVAAPAVFPVGCLAEVVAAEVTAFLADQHAVVLVVVHLVAVVGFPILPSALVEIPAVAAPDVAYFALLRFAVAAVCFPAELLAGVVVAG